MKIATIIITILAIALMTYNATKIDLDAPFAGDSQVAIITILAAGCAILLLQILRISKNIEKKARRQN